MKLSEKRRIADYKAQLRREGKAPGSRYHIKDCGGGLVDASFTAGRASTRFDEVAVDSWLHVERLDNRSFYGTIAGITLWWTVERDGTATITHAECRDVQFLPRAFSWLFEQINRSEQKLRGRKVSRKGGAK